MDLIYVGLGVALFAFAVEKAVANPEISKQEILKKMGELLATYS